MLAWLLLMATTLVSNIAVFSDATGHGNQSHLVYAPVQQRWWLFYLDSKTATTVKTVVSSSNDLTTATWSAGSASSAFPSSHALSSNDQRNLAVAFVPTAINGNDAAHVSVGIGPSATAAGFTEHVRAKFTGSSSITWETWADLAPGSFAWPATKGNALGVSSSGKVHEAAITLSTAGGGGNAYGRLSTNADSGSTWTTGFGAVTTIETVANTVNQYAIGALASDAMLLAYENGGAADPTMTNVRWVKYASGTAYPTGGADVFASTNSIDSNDWCLCTVDATHTYCFRRATSATFEWRVFNGTSWSSPTNAPPTFGGSGIPKSAAGMFAATDGTDLYFFAIDNASNGPVYYCKASAANGTPTWGSWTLLESAGSAARNFISGSPVVSNSQVGVIYTEANGSNFDIKLSVLALTPPAPYIPYDLAHSPQHQSRMAI